MICNGRNKYLGVRHQYSYEQWLKTVGGRVPISFEGLNGVALNCTRLLGPEQSFGGGPRGKTSGSSENVIYKTA